jgi:hypothetical protein
MENNFQSSEIISFVLKEENVYELNFLGHISYFHGSEEYLFKIMNKFSKAYSLIPKDSVIIPENKVHLYDNKLIGGILRDSLYAVYGIGRQGLPGYSCSIYFIPSKNFLSSVVDYPETDLTIK